MTAAAKACEWHMCRRPVHQPAGRGRPARYCGTACRKAAYRYRLYLAGVERERAEQARMRVAELAAARAELRSLGPQLDAAMWDHAELAERMVLYASRVEGDRDDALALAIGKFERSAALMVRLTRAVQHAEAAIAMLAPLCPGAASGRQPPAVRAGDGG
jgi:hypothetical protein